jgi:hypothetical protein
MSENDTLFDDPVMLMEEDYTEELVNKGRKKSPTISSVKPPPVDVFINDETVPTKEQRIAKLYASIKAASDMAKCRAFPEEVRKKFESKIAGYQKELETLLPT